MVPIYRRVCAECKWIVQNLRGGSKGLNSDPEKGSDYKTVDIFRCAPCTECVLFLSAQMGFKLVCLHSSFIRIKISNNITNIFFILSWSKHFLWCSNNIFQFQFGIIRQNGTVEIETKFKHRFESWVSFTDSQPLLPCSSCIWLQTVNWACFSCLLYPFSLRDIQQVGSDSFSSIFWF